MEIEIIIKNHKLFFEKDVELPCKPLNLEIAKTNLLKFKKELDKEGVDFTLFFGTLLGAVRERNFIKHDEDIDICVFNEESLLNLIPILREKGFAFIRYDEDLKIYSFIKDEVYIDVYIPKKVNGIMGAKYVSIIGQFFPKKYFNRFGYLEFLGEEFRVPYNTHKVLCFLYGKNWKIPIVDKKPYGMGKVNKIKTFLSTILGVKTKRLIRKIVNLDIH